VSVPTGADPELIARLTAAEQELARAREHADALRARLREADAFVAALGPPASPEPDAVELPSASEAPQTRESDAPQTPEAEVQSEASGPEPAAPRRTGGPGEAAEDNGSSLEAMRAAINEQPDDPDLWLALAKSEASLRYFPAAVEAALTAAELRPGWRTALVWALRIAARTGDPAMVREVTERFGAIRELDVQTLALAGPIALRAGAHDLAAELGAELLRHDPQHEVGLFLAAAARWEQGDEARADALIEDALGTGRPSAVHAALRYDRHTDRVDRIERLLERLDPPDGSALVESGVMLIKRGEPDRGLALLDRAGPLDDRAAAAAAEGRALKRVLSGAWCRNERRIPTEPVMGRPLHMLQRTLPYHTAGGSYRTHHTAVAQKAAGLDPHMVTELGFPWSMGVIDPPERDVLDGIPYRRLRDPAPQESGLDRFLQRSLEALIDLTAELRPSVLHPASIYPNPLLALELRRTFGRPVVYEVRGFPEDRLMRRPGSRAMHDRHVGRRELENYCMREADRVVTLAEVMKEHMISRGIDPAKIVVIPNAVDTDKLRPATRHEGLARQLGIGSEDTTLGYISTFHPYEGIQYIIQAVATLRERGRRARAVIVGDGSERAVLEQEAVDLGVAQYVAFTGRVPHERVGDYYSLIDLFIVPRRFEPTSELVTPLKPFEAMATERCVIVSDVRALREIVDDGHTGRVFRPDDSDHLADLCEELIDDPQETRRLAANGRAWVASERTWSRNARRYIDLYRELGAV
jgi:glycosyltransferase involved in cell wall biosynthesis